MNKFTILITILFLAGCAKSLIPMPNTLMPEVNRDVISAESYGPYPKNYQKILKDYLQENFYMSMNIKKVLIILHIQCNLY